MQNEEVTGSTDKVRRIRLGLIFDWLQPGIPPGETLKTSTLARLVGVSRPTVLNWGSGRSSPTSEQETAIRKYLGLDEDLFGEYKRLSESYVDFSLPLVGSGLAEDSRPVKILKVFRQCALRMQDLIARRLEAAAFDPALRRRISDWTRPHKSEEPFALDTLCDDAIFKTLLKENQSERLGMQAFVSEESLPKQLGTDSSTPLRSICLVDPLDGSGLAVRGLGGALNLVAYDLVDQSIIAALVIDYLSPVRMYYACDTVDGAYCELASGKQLPLIPVHREVGYDPLSDGLVLGHYHGSLERKGGVPDKEPVGDKISETSHTSATANALWPRSEAAEESELIRGLQKDWKRGLHPMPRFVERLGSLGLCGVASGAIDGFYEVSKGFMPHDCWAGLYIASKAKCKLRILRQNIEGKPKRPGLAMDENNLKFFLRGIDAGTRVNIGQLAEAFKDRWEFVAARHESVLNRLVRDLAEN